jgi:hypothetical protein
MNNSCVLEIPTDESYIGDHARTKTSFNGSINLLDWINAPKKFCKGMNIDTHIRNVKRFIQQINAPRNYAIAILTNSLDEESQLELFARPEFEDTEENIEVIEHLLRTIFVEPKTEISNLVALFGQKQEANETVTNFLTRLRVKAYQLMGVGDKDQKEKCILSAFINGLRDRRIAKAVELIEPSDSESALFVAKKEESKQGKNSDDCCFNFSREDQADQSSTQTLIKEMGQQIKLLSQQVLYLTNLIKKRSPERQLNEVSNGERTYAEVTKVRPQMRPQPRVFQPKVFQPRPVPASNRVNPVEKRSYMQCWNCNQNGHSWRNCWKRIVCKSCLSTGHISRFCRNGEAVRYLEMEENNDEVKSLDEKLSVITEETDENNDCLTIQETEPRTLNQETWKGQRKEKKRTKRTRIQDSEYHKNITEWVDFVNGKQSKKPKHYQPTVISESRSETAANKPLVRGKCESRNVPILIDSGAALNVIDESFVKEFGNNVKIRPESVTIRCANNGKVASLGKVWVKTKIGSHEEYMKFSVIPNLFPKVILGLRQMKHSDIVIDAKFDSVWIKGDKVPFMSKTRPMRTENH